MKMITLYVPESYLQALDDIVKQGRCPHRAEAIRLAIRDFIAKEGWLPKAEFSAESAENLNLAMRIDKLREEQF